jgi:PAS domain S-box-containing protein
MMWVTDPSGYCIYLNRRWYEFTGQSKAEAEGFGWLDATHPDDKARTEEAFHAANAERLLFQIEYRLRRADGSYRWVLDTASPRLSEAGEFLGYVGSVIDIHERIQAEERLRESEDHFRHTVELNPQVPWTADPDGNITSYSSRWLEMTGQTPDEPYETGWAKAVHRRISPNACPLFRGPCRGGAHRRGVPHPHCRNRRAPLDACPRLPSPGQGRRNRPLVRDCRGYPRPQGCGAGAEGEGGAAQPGSGQRP